MGTGTLSEDEKKQVRKLTKGFPNPRKSPLKRDGAAPETASEGAIATFTSNVNGGSPTKPLAESA